MANLKVGGVVAAFGVILLFVSLLIQSIFVPQIVTRLTTLKASAPTSAENDSLDQAVSLMFQIPLMTVLASFLLIVAGGVIAVIGKAG